MDLSPGQRRAAFAVIVVALAALGAFVLVPRLAPGRPPGATAAVAGGAQAARSSGPARSPVPLPGAPAPIPSAAPVPSAGAPGPPAGAPAAPVNIYRWLPFSQAGLAAAASVVLRFAADFATYSAAESAAAYVRRMSGLVTPELAATLARGYATPGLAQQRRQQGQSATGTGRITALRAFGSSSITFLVTVEQKVTDRHGTRASATGYAVTVTGAGTAWQVSDIELASAGNS
jgi:hypothetical protein